MLFTIKNWHIYFLYIYQGAGTRKGNGECLCNTGYSGILCDSCSNNYYEAYKDESKVLCEKCHKACNGPCSGVSDSQIHFDIISSLVAEWIMDLVVV